MKALLALVLLALPVFGQFTNAHSIWGRAVSSDAPTDGYAITWSVSQNKFIFSAAAGSASHTIQIFVAGAPIGVGTASVGIPGIVNYSCTINKATIIANASGSITVDIWKAAGAVPGSGDKISASAPVTLSSAQLNTTGPVLTTWTKTVTANDVIWASVATVDGVLTAASITLTCQ